MAASPLMLVWSLIAISCRDTCSNSPGSCYYNGAFLLDNHSSVAFVVLESWVRGFFFFFWEHHGISRSTAALQAKLFTEQAGHYFWMDSAVSQGPEGSSCLDCKALWYNSIGPHLQMAIYRWTGNYCSYYVYISAEFKISYASYFINWWFLNICSFLRNVIISFVGWFIPVHRGK